jgi:hypothetical protein
MSYSSRELLSYWWLMAGWWLMADTLTMLFFIYYQTNADSQQAVNINPWPTINLRCNH